MLSYCSLISIHGEKQSEDAPEVILEERIKAPRDAAVHLREYLKSTHIPLSLLRTPKPSPHLLLGPWGASGYCVDILERVT